MHARKKTLGLWLENMSRRVTDMTGSSWAFSLALLAIFIWLISGPVFHFSDTWQLVINTGTTIITFLMVFLIQRAQNKDSLAVHLKLNEIVASITGASNRLIDVESLGEHDLRILHQHYARLVAMAKTDETLLMSHSVEEAETRHDRKRVQEKFNDHEVETEMKKDSSAEPST